MRAPSRATELLKRAYGDGDLSKQSSEALLALNGTAEIERVLGEDSDNDLSPLLLVTLLVDDSASVAIIDGGADAVRRGHNHCLEALEEERIESVLVHTRRLFGGSVGPFRPLATAPRLSVENYIPNAPVTPLYQNSALTLGSVMAKAKAEAGRGRRVRAFTLIVTDGEDNASRDIGADQVRFLVSDMLEFSDDYIVAGMGVGSEPRFRRIFQQMGIPNKWILTTGASQSEIQALFRRIAKSLQLAASGDAGWLQLEAGPVSGD